MNAFHQQAYHQSGTEILSGQLEPSCYASAMAEAQGDSTLAMGIYAKNRAEKIADDLKRHSARDKERFQAMNLEPPKTLCTRETRELFILPVLGLSIFFGLLSVLIAFYGKNYGLVTPGAIMKVTATALLGSGCCFSLAACIKYKFPQIEFTKTMFPLSILFSLASVGSGISIVINRTSIGWGG